jgi:hypothetical protein
MSEDYTSIVKYMIKIYKCDRPFVSEEEIIRKLNIPEDIVKYFKDNHVHISPKPNKRLLLEMGNIIENPHSFIISSMIQGTAMFGSEEDHKELDDILTKLEEDPSREISLSEEQLARDNDLRELWGKVCESIDKKD